MGDPWEELEQQRQEFAAEALAMAEQHQLEAAREFFGLNDGPLTGWNEPEIGE